MCRLLAFASKRATTARELLGEREFESFLGLSFEHGDGWGMGWHDGHGELNVEKDVEAAHASDLLDKLARTTEMDAMVLHLRNASPGMRIGYENTHPFSSGKLAFAHNGWIRPTAELERLLTPATRDALRGTTDSECYFQLLLAGVEEIGSVELALPPLLERLRGSFRCNALNFVLLTEQRLYAVCDFSQEAADRRGDPEYYTLGYRRTADAVVVGSSGPWGDRPSWTSMANHQALVVDRDSLQTSLLQVG
jgi:predicted glutamine amidotransferase